MDKLVSGILVVSVILFPISILLSSKLFSETANNNLLLSDMFIVTAFIISLIGYIYKRFPVLRVDSVVISLAGLAFAQLTTVVFSDGQMTSCMRMFVQYALFVCFASLCLTTYQFKKIFSLLIVALLIIPISVIFEAIAASVGYHVGNSWFGNYENSNRYVGITGDTAQSSMISLLIMIVYGAKVLKSSPRHLNLNAIPVAISLLGILLTQTRGTLICLFLAMIYLMLIYPRRISRLKKIKISTSLSVLIVFVVVGVFLAPETLERFYQTEDAGVSSRLVPMYYSLNAALASPAFGVGFGNSFKMLRSMGYGEDIGYVGAFNQYLHVFLESGVVGLLALLLFLFFSVRLIKRFYKLSSYSEYATGMWLWSILLIFVYQSEVWISPGSYISMVWFACLGISMAYTRAILKGKMDDSMPKPVTAAA